jgi:hypothetical protein
MSTPDNQVRHDILELLYKRFRDDENSSGVDRAIIQANLGLTEKQMDTNMLYLEEKALVAFSITKGSQWTIAKITADGIAVLQNKERYADKLPSTQAITNQIPKDNQNAIHPVQPELSFTEQLAEAFDKANHQVFAKNISSSKKGKIEKQLRELERELRKVEKADLGKIQQSWEWLKKNAGWVNPTIAQVVLEGVKTALEIT